MFRDKAIYPYRDHFTRHYGNHVTAPMLVPGIILTMDTAIERRRYIVTSSLIGRAHIQYDPCNFIKFAILLHVYHSLCVHFGWMRQKSMIFAGDLFEEV